MMSVALITLAIIYGGLGCFVWGAYQKQSRHYPLRSELAILGIALLIHGLLLLIPVVQKHMITMGLGYAVSLIVWLMLMLYWSGSFFYSLKGLQLFLYPCAAGSMLLASVFPNNHIGYAVDNIPFILHIGASLLAYGLFGIVTLLAILILLLDRRLRTHQLSPLVSFLPPLLSLEKLLFQGMRIGFWLLTFSLVSGTIFAEEVFGKPFEWTHKSVFGIISWLIYGALLLKHHLTAWRGKQVAIWSIIGFASLVLAYVGSKFVLEIILHR